MSGSRVPLRRLVPVAIALVGGLLATTLLHGRVRNLDDQRVRLEFE